MLEHSQHLAETAANNNTYQITISSARETKRITYQ